MYDLCIYVCMHVSINFCIYVFIGFSSSAGCVLLHQHKVRDVNAGQFPLMIIHGVGKSQGESFLADMTQWLSGELLDSVTVIGMFVYMCMCI